MLSRVGKFFSGHVDETLHRPPAVENSSFDGLEMIPLNDSQRDTYASVPFAGERAARARPPPSPLAWLWRAALGLLAAAPGSRAVGRTLAAEQRFLARAGCSRFRRVSWIAAASLFWGFLLTLVSSCGVILALTGDLGKMLVEEPGIWFVQFTSYLMAYSTAVHVAQMICALLLLTSVKMAETSPPRSRDPTEEEITQWFSSLGFSTVCRGGQSCQPIRALSKSPPPAPLHVPSPERTRAVLQVHAQVEHSLDGQKATANTRSPSPARSAPLSPNAPPSTWRAREAAKCAGALTAEPSMGSSPGGQGTTPRKSTMGSSIGTSTSLQSLTDKLPHEGPAARGARTSDVERAQRPVRLRAPWLWTSAASLATYAIAAVAFYCAGNVAVPTTLCAIIGLSTPCILDVLAEVLEVPEKKNEDLERLFGPDPSSASHVERSQAVAARSIEAAALEDRSSPEFSEATCSLQLRDLSSE